MGVSRLPNRLTGHPIIADRVKELTESGDHLQAFYTLATAIEAEIYDMQGLEPPSEAGKNMLKLVEETP